MHVTPDPQPTSVTSHYYVSIEVLDAAVLILERMPTEDGPETTRRRAKYIEDSDMDSEVEESETEEKETEEWDHFED